MLRPEGSSRSAPAPSRILIVGDEVGTMEEVSTYLRRGGYLVRVARDGKSTPEALKEPPVLAIVDGHLPDMDAVDLIEPLQTAVPGMPVILITAWPNPILYADAMERGAAACLSRPFSLWSFGIILQQVLRANWMPGTRPWHARRAFRTNLAVPLIVHRPDTDEPLLGQVRDLSHTGAMLVVPGRIGAGQSVVMEFGPPEHIVRLEATVLWGREDALHPGSYLYGARFLQSQSPDFAYEYARQVALWPRRAGREAASDVLNRVRSVCDEDEQARTDAASE